MSVLYAQTTIPFGLHQCRLIGAFVFRPFIFHILFLLYDIYMYMWVFVFRFIFTLLSNFQPLSHILHICYTTWNSAFSHLSPITTMLKNIEAANNSGQLTLLQKSFHTIYGEGEKKPYPPTIKPKKKVKQKIINENDLWRAW